MKNLFAINLKYDSSGTSIFGPSNQELWKHLRRKAVGSGAYKLKMQIKETFERLMPAASKPITSKEPNTKKRWKGVLSNVVRQGHIDDLGSMGVFTNVHILGTRKSGHGDFIGLFYNKGNFRSPDRKGKRRANREFRQGRKIANKGFYKAQQAQNFKPTDRNYHSRGDIEAYNFFEQGTQGFDFVTTVDKVLNSYIQQINNKKK